MPTPVSRDGQHRGAARPASSAASHAISPVERELEGVRDQVEDDLLPHVAIDVDRLRQRRAVDGQAQAGLAGGRARSSTRARRSGGADRPARNAPAPARLRCGRSRAASSPACSRRRLLRCASLEAVAVHAAAARRPVLVQRILERPQHQGERGAELVADVGEEGGLGAVDLGQRLGAPRAPPRRPGRWRWRRRSGRPPGRGSRGSCRRTGGTD